MSLVATTNQNLGKHFQVSQVDLVQCHQREKIGQYLHVTANYYKGMSEEGQLYRLVHWWYTSLGKVLLNFYNGQWTQLSPAYVPILEARLFHLPPIFYNQGEKRLQALRSILTFKVTTTEKIQY